MPDGYLNKINKMRPKRQLSVVKRIQNSPFGVVELHQFAFFVQRIFRVTLALGEVLIFFDFGIFDLGIGDADF